MKVFNGQIVNAKVFTDRSKETVLASSLFLDLSLAADEHLRVVLILINLSDLRCEEALSLWQR